jgi:2',3'-cyclic-nucleotide 2'-phosphodiesterase (5'-nucleotidase family)
MTGEGNEGRVGCSLRAGLLGGVWLVAALLSACSAPEPAPRVTDVTPRPARTGGEGTLLLLADIRGVTRPCGCTVELQKGGFDRLIPVLESERARASAVRLVHAGPLFHETLEPDAKKKAQRARQAEVVATLTAMAGIDIAAAHPVDAAFGDASWRALADTSRARWTLTNGAAPGAAETQRLELGGLVVGIIALAPELDGAPASWALEPPQEAARAAVAELRGQVDAVLLLSGLGLRETKRLLRKVDGIDFAVVGGMGEHPTVSSEVESVGGARIFQFHREGRYLGRLELRRGVNDEGAFVDVTRPSPEDIAALETRRSRLAERQAELAASAGTTPEARSMARTVAYQITQLDAELASLRARAERVPAGRPAFSFTLLPLHWDLPQADAPLAIMNAFDEELARINVANAGKLPEAKPGEPVYVGVDTCFECHAETREFWATNRHAHAWATLERGKKTFDAECVSCHVTGYDRPGGALVGQVAGRENVQCEACHGPGSLHAEDGDVSLIVKDPPVATCVSCHNTHHSPGFSDATYREALRVPGHGRPMPDKSK